MKLTPIFNFIRNRIAGHPSIKLVTWYNNQDSEGTIHADPAVFIEFPDTLNIENLQGQTQQSEITVRVWLFTKIHSAKDGSINGELLQAHETIAQDIYHALHLFGIRDENDGIVTNSLTRVGFTLDMSEPGWAITKQDFACMVYQHPVYPNQKIDWPVLDVNIVE